MLPNRIHTSGLGDKETTKKSVSKKKYYNKKMGWVFLLSCNYSSPMSERIPFQCIGTESEKMSKTHSPDIFSDWKNN